MRLPRAPNRLAGRTVSPGEPSRRRKICLEDRGELHVEGTEVRDLSSGEPSRPMRRRSPHTKLVPHPAFFRALWVFHSNPREPRTPYSLRAKGGGSPEDISEVLADMMRWGLVREEKVRKGGEWGQVSRLYWLTMEGQRAAEAVGVLDALLPPPYGSGLAPVQAPPAPAHREPAPAMARANPPRPVEPTEAEIEEAWTAHLEQVQAGPTSKSPETKPLAPEKPPAAVVSPSGQEEADSEWNMW